VIVIKTLLFILLFCGYVHGEIAHLMEIAPEWHRETHKPFNELILSWNGARPEQGKIDFYIRVKTEEWSSWLHYASWGKDEQCTFNVTMGDVKSYQDAIELLNGKKASAFEVKIVSASQDSLHALHVYTNGDKHAEPKFSYPLEPVQIDVKGLSQMALKHARSQSLCSPTSTTAVLRYLTQSPIDPLEFAAHARDHRFDIYGNWILNAAQASAELGSDWNCWVERLDGFSDIYNRLIRGFPVVISIRGPLQGSALPYEQGHLIAIIGYQPVGKRVLCMDPAFPSDEETVVSYDLDDLMQAWNRRGRVAYLFEAKKG
jgi:hypothetical protein